MSRGKLALQYFEEGYNCSQAVVLAFADLLDIDFKQAAKLASGFGGGMGRLREVCGAVSGMFMVVDMLYGYDSPDKGEKKKELYSRIQELGLQFEKDNGSLICREIMKLNVKHDDPTPTQRTPDFYQTRPCPNKIFYAANLLEEYINNHPYKV
ncbi:MAG: C-GCAxxG-C-C family protein [Erysipelotrichaceae bacterium]|nr:C-GCAxxG-C-C family protein [Erysipelotrichaceae bacterium]